MSTKNLNAIVNSLMDGEINTRRGNKWRSYFKRQSRRQARHRLASELNANIGEHFADALEPWIVGNDHVLETGYTHSGAAVPIGLNPRKAVQKSVVVIQKARPSPLERNLINADRLVA